MNRTARDRTGDHPSPVQRIELNEDKLHVRFILAVVFLAIGVGAILFALTKALTPETGWQEIQAGGGGYSVAPEFTFYYDLGADGGSLTAEKKRLTVAYTQAAAEAYQIFNAHEEYEGVGNLASLSRRPNETVTVDPALWRALRELEDAGSRIVYLGPVYEMYYSLFQSADETEAGNYDPVRNRDLADWCARAAAFAGDPASVRLELTDGDRARLAVSEEYLAFLEESAAETVLDLFWLRNAAAADYLAEQLTAAGFSRGVLSSRDGFTRNLNTGEETFSLNVYHRSGQTVYPAAVVRYRGPMSVVSLYGYPVSGATEDWYFALPDGSIRHPYVDPADGLCRAAAPELVGYSRERTCVETALALAEVFIADALDTGALSALAAAGVDTLRCGDGVVYHTDPDIVFEALYRGESMSFRAEHAP